MSADNGVYILKTGNQYRVKHLQAIDNLYWDYCKTQFQNTIVPTRIFEMFCDCKYTYNCETAFKIANNIFKKLSICEYGIQLIDTNMSWGMVLKRARIHINKEIEQCRNDNVDVVDDLKLLKQELDNTYSNKKKVNKKQSLCSDKFCTICENAEWINCGNGYYKLKCKLDYESYTSCQIDFNKRKAGEKQ